MMKNDEGESGEGREIEGSISSRGKFSRLDGLFLFKRAILKHISLV